MSVTNTATGLADCTWKELPLSIHKCRHVLATARAQAKSAAAAHLSMLQLLQLRGLLGMLQQLLLPVPQAAGAGGVHVAALISLQHDP